MTETKFVTAPEPDKPQVVFSLETDSDGDIRVTATLDGERHGILYISQVDRKLHRFSYPKETFDTLGLKCDDSNRLLVDQH